MKKFLLLAGLAAGAAMLSLSSTAEAGHGYGYGSCRTGGYSAYSSYGRSYYPSGGYYSSRGYIGHRPAYVRDRGHHHGHHYGHRSHGYRRSGTGVYIQGRGFGFGIYR